jgi:hypothetical protein
MNSPAALLSPKVAVAEVLKLAKSLGISVTGIGSQSAPNGARVVTAPSVVRDNFPIIWDKATRTITLPGIYVDFAFWQYIPPREVFGGPLPKEDKYLRVVLDVTWDNLDFWPTISVGTPYFEWVSWDEVGNVLPTLGWIRDIGNDKFYCYIVKIFQDEEPKLWSGFSSPLLKISLDSFT